MYWTAGARDKAIACFQLAIEVGPAYDPTAGHNLASIQSGSATQLDSKNETAKHASVPCLPAGTVQRMTASSP